MARRAKTVLGAYFTLQCDLAAAPDVLGAFAAEHALDLGDALAMFGKRAAAIEARAPAAPIRFEAGFGRPLDYYTGLVFDIVAGDAGEGAAPLAGGGRYDRLMEMLGAKRPVPAIGFTLQLESTAGEARP